MARTVITRLRALGRDEEGQDLLEYALLATLIALVAYAAVEATGGSVDTFYDHITDTIDDVIA